jgi:hypothetical protein
MSWAVVNRIYCSEIQPMATRAAATSLGQCANWVCSHSFFSSGFVQSKKLCTQVVNWIIAFTTPLFLAHSSSGPYFLFGSCATLTVLVCVLFQPESRGISLEALEGVFAVSPWRRMLSRTSTYRHGRASAIPLRTLGADAGGVGL